MFNPSNYNYPNHKKPAKKTKSYIDEDVDIETDEELKEN